MTSVKIDFKHYHTYQEVTDLLKEFASNYPNLATLRSIGKSAQGRDLWVIEITNKKTGLAIDKPAFWVDGNTHAGEVTGSENCLKATWHLLTKYGHDKFVTGLLDSRALYIMPRLNPDGAELYLTTPYQRVAGAVPNPEFDEFAEGLYEEDLDGDGNITQMRIKDPKGDWKVSEKDSRLMTKRKPEDVGGTYYRLYREGLIKNYDGGAIKFAPSRWIGGSNRNYPAAWSPLEHDQGGLFPLWENETYALAEFFYEHQNIGGLLTYHTFGGIVLRPYAQWSDQRFSEKDLEEDLNTYNTLGAIAKKMSGWPVTSPYEGMTNDKKRPRHGCSMDWWYEHFGLIMFSVEVSDMESRIGLGDFIERGRMTYVYGSDEEKDLKVLKWIDKETKGKGFADWKQFRHPQLGLVEIGGLKTKYTLQNPPPHLLESDLDKIYRFPMVLTSMLPLVKITKTEVTSLGDNIYKIKATIENLGFLSSYIMEQSKKIKLNRPVKVKLEFNEDVELLAGKERIKLGDLKGRTERLLGHPTYGAPEGREEESMKTVEWIVRAKKVKPKVKIVSVSQKGGKDEREVELK